MAEFGPSFVSRGADSDNLYVEEPSDKMQWTFTGQVLRAAVGGKTVEIQPGDWVQAWYGPKGARRVVVGEYKIYASRTADAVVNLAARATGSKRPAATGPWGAMLDVERGKKWFVVDEDTNPTLVKLDPSLAERLRKARLDRWLKREFHDMAVAAYLSELQPTGVEIAEKFADALVRTDRKVFDAINDIQQVQHLLYNLTIPTYDYFVPENLPPLTHRRW